jgi:predicted amidohydrolase
MHRNFKIAAVQFEPLQGEIERNRANTQRLVRSAAAQGASLVVLPECCIGGLIFADRDEIRAVSETIPGPSTALWSALSRETGAWIAAGLSEREGDKVYNSAVLVGPSGELHRHRKLHVRGIEERLFDVGDALRCFETPLGRVGLAICYDMWFPEVGRALADAGADIVASPSNWNKSPRIAEPFDRFGLSQPYHLLAAAAIANEVVVVGANRIGLERGVEFYGASCILGPSGEELTPVASRDREEILVAQLPDVAAVRAIGGRHLRHRQPASYVTAR